MGWWPRGAGQVVVCSDIEADICAINAIPLSYSSSDRYEAFRKHDTDTLIGV
jgi:hypothetical protein